MTQGELVVAKLGKGATLVRLLQEEGAQIVVALGRNKQARIPHNRIIMSTGIVPKTQDFVEEFWAEATSLSNKINLTSVWKSIGRKSNSIHLSEIAASYWNTSPSPVQLVALAFHLDNGTDYFDYDVTGYLARSSEEIKDRQARKKAESEKLAAVKSLMESLCCGRVPNPMTVAQSKLLNQLKEYATHGDDPSPGHITRSLFDMLPGFGDLQQRAFNLLVTSGVLSEDEPLEIIKAGIQSDFPPEVISAAKSLSLTELISGNKCKDLTHLEVVTIDNEGTDDRDDALSIDLSGKIDGTFQLGVHIADAATLIKPKGAIDREAYKRMATLYVPEGKVAMVPSELTSNIGSLDPNQERLALSLLMDIGPSGSVVAFNVSQTLIRSRAALTYRDVDRDLKKNEGHWHKLVKCLHLVTAHSRAKREAAGAINLERPEMAIKVKQNGTVDTTVLDRSSPARNLVAELMILSNTILANFLNQNHIPAIFRSQIYASNMDNLGLPQNGSDEKGQEIYKRFLLAKKLRPAELSITPSSHRGLGVDSYIQATSPLRRYPDLVMLRQIIHFLRSGQPFYSIDELYPIVHRAEEELRELARIEENRKRYWFLKYLLQTRLKGAGNPFFQSVVLDQTPNRSALIELLEFPFRARVVLPKSCSPGETINLRLENIDLWRKSAKFVLEQQIP